MSLSLSLVSGSVFVWEHLHLNNDVVISALWANKLSVSKLIKHYSLNQLTVSDYNLIFNLFCKFLYRKKIISSIKQNFGRKRERQVKKEEEKKERSTEQKKWEKTLKNNWGTEGLSLTCQQDIKPHTMTEELWRRRKRRNSQSVFSPHILCSQLLHHLHTRWCAGWHCWKQ